MFHYLPYPGDLAVSPNQGTWVITSFAVSNAIALALTGWFIASFRPGAAICFVNAAVHAGLLAMRVGSDFAVPDCSEGAARGGGRADDPVVAKPAAIELSQ